MQRELATELLKWVRNQLDMNDTVDVEAIEMLEEDSLESGPNFGNRADVLTCIMVLRKLYNHPSLVLETLDQVAKRRHGLISSKTVSDRKYVVLLTFAAQKLFSYRLH